MMSSYRSAFLFSTILLVPAFATPQQPPSSMQGRFQSSIDLGHAQPGASSYDPATQVYTLQGGGADVWGSADDFRFTWTKISGDVTLTADVQVLQPSTHPKAKGMLMVRQTLDPGSPYADIAVHGDGHITLQYRLTPGGETKDTDLPAGAAGTLQLTRHGDVFTAMVLPAGNGALARPSITISMKGLVYVGLGVCAHSTTALQTVKFDHVQITP